MANHSFNAIRKFADDTIGQVAGFDKSMYRSEIEHLAEWCRSNNHLFNIYKTKELIIDFRNGMSGDHTWFSLVGQWWRLVNFQVLVINILTELSWAQHM